jgi:hypothetical protein
MKRPGLTELESARRNRKSFRDAEIWRFGIWHLLKWIITNVTTGLLCAHLTLLYIRVAFALGESTETPGGILRSLHRLIIVAVPLLGFGERLYA